MTVLLVAGTDLRRRLRNRSAIVTAFVAPLALAVVFSVLIGGAGQQGFDIGVVDADGSQLSRAVAGELTAHRGRGVVSFTRLATVARARSAVDHDDVGAAVVIPRGFAAGVRAGRPKPMLVLQSPDRRRSRQVAHAIALPSADGTS